MSKKIKSRRKIQLFSTTVVVAALSLSAANAQVSFGADVVSRYIWRGIDFGESVSIQPALSFSTGGFEMGSWASYAISPLSSDVNEHDLWASYSVDLGEGALSLMVTDYYFPNAGFGFFDFDGVEGDTVSGGGHWIEPAISYAGGESFPLSLLVGTFVHNDPYNSIYFEAGYPLSVSDVGLDLLVAGTAGKSALYGATGAGLLAVGVTATKEVPLTAQFSLPLSVSYILNPTAERTYLILGFSF